MLTRNTTLFVAHSPAATPDKALLELFQLLAPVQITWMVVVGVSPNLCRGVEFFVACVARLV
jgi:hypothetical protein